MRASLAVLWLAAAVLWGGTPCQAQSGSSVGESEAKAASVWQRGWYEARGIELPLPFGIGVNPISMERDIEVTDVTVKLGDRPPESIADRASFDVANRTTLSMVRVDAWVLQFVDLYLMAGQTRTDTSLLASFEIAPPVGNPIPMVVEKNSRVDGPLYGGGDGAAVNKKTGERTYMKMGTVGVGLGLGAQKYQVIFLFQDEATFRSFVDKGWQADVTAQAAAGTAGIGGQTGFVNGIAIYQITDKGLMASPTYLAPSSCRTRSSTRRTESIRQETRFGPVENSRII